MKSIIINLILLLIVLNTGINSQVRDSLIEIYPGIGYSMDRSELDKTSMLNLKRFTTFQEAKFFIRNDSLLVINITYLDAEGTTKDTTVITRSSIISNIRVSLHQKSVDEVKNLKDVPEIILTTTTGERHKGKIENADHYSVTVVINEDNFGYTTTDKEIFKETFLKTELKKVIIPGESNVSDGLMIGLGVGVVTGVILGAAEGDDPPGFLSLSAGSKAYLAGILLGSIGTVAGLVLGIITSTSDNEIIINEDYDLTELNKYALYK